MRSARLNTRLGALSKRLGPCCPGCAGRPSDDSCLFRYRGVLLTGRGEPVDESLLRPCPVCGRGGVLKTLVGVDPRLVLGLRVIEGVDPACV